MATVASLNEIGKKFKTLGWDLPVADVPNWLAAQNIPAADLIAYLDAAIAAPSGWSDGTVNGAKITTALKARGIVVT